MSAVLAIANPHRIKRSHRRRGKVTAGRFVQRYYDPIVGRFLSVDPVSTDPNNGGNFNRYWYGNNNPYKFTDPDGRQVVIIVEQHEAPPVTALPGEGPYSGTTTKPSLGEVVVKAIVKASENIDISIKAVTLVAKYYLNEAIGENDNSPTTEAPYPNNPDNSDFDRINGGKGAKVNPEDGSVWERDTAGHGNREGEGSQWKRWPNKKSWDKGETPNSIWPDGRVRK